MARNSVPRFRQKTLAGPWRISAAGAVDGVPSEFSVTTGRMQEEGSLRVAIDARRFDQPYRLTVDGPVEMRDGVLAGTAPSGSRLRPARAGSPKRARCRWWRPGPSSPRPMRSRRPNTGSKSATGTIRTRSPAGELRRSATKSPSVSRRTAGRSTSTSCQLQHRRGRCAGREIATRLARAALRSSTPFPCRRQAAKSISSFRRSSPAIRSSAR